jgi:hypothetical protein
MDGSLEKKRAEAQRKDDPQVASTPELVENLASTSQPSMLASALEYAEMGLPVFPCEAGGKKPDGRLAPHGFQDATTDEAQIRSWWQDHPDANIGMPTGKVSGVLAVDVDPRNGGKESLAELTTNHGRWPKTAVQRTGGGGVHFLFQYAGATPKVLATGIDLKGDGGYIIVAPSVHPSGGRYQWANAEGAKALSNVVPPPAWILAHIAGGVHPTTRGAAVVDEYNKWKPGQRNTKLASLAGVMRRHGISREAIEAALLAENRQRCEPPLEELDVKKIAKSIAGYAPVETDEASWPGGLQEEAFHGIVGKIVRAIEPHTEADSAALLIQFLVVFGNIIGRGPHFSAESTPHFFNLFAMLVGQTATGRKGTALGWVQRLFDAIDTQWKTHCVTQGLVSGEGLVWNVRDRVTKMVLDKRTGNLREEEIDKGVEDKRLLVIEQEFGGVLQAAERQSNTLSAVMRQAWDGNNLRTMAKANPAQATEPHVSIIGHITDEELKQLLTKTAVCNGFVNRFLCICTTRSKCLPNGGHVDPAMLGAYGTRLKRLVAFARTVGLVERDEAAAAIWNAVYPDLTAGMPGMLGKATSRSAPQTMRLAGIYALLDGCSVVRAAHMLAALAVWQYSENSARFIFGETLGHKIADNVLSELRQRPEGMSRNEIRDCFNRNKSADAISNAMRSLQAKGLVRSEKRLNTGGRAGEIWFARSGDAENAENAVTIEAPNPGDAENAVPVEAPNPGDGDLG